MSLVRVCLDCGRKVRGRSWCPRCWTAKEQTRSQVKRQRRPDRHNDHAERMRRARVVADHRAMLGDWCSGWERQPSHPAADLTADHVREVATGGDPSGPLVVRCRSCNAARSAHLAHRILTAMQVNDPSPGEPAITHRDDDPGPVAA
jgi:5-methylcytosine-specific restriction protein A